jgi:hypothetical protein
MQAAVSATSLYFFDLSYGNQNDSLYFTDQEWAGELASLLEHWRPPIPR